MNVDRQQALNEHVNAIAQILYADADSQGLPMGNLAEIEMTVRHQLQSQVSPQLGKFFIQSRCPEDTDSPRYLKSTLGTLSLGPKQALTLGVQPRVQQSPYLAMCCLRMCAKASYQQAETDIAMLTGIRVSAKTQERMVKRSHLPDPVSDEPVQELALDGGMVRVRTPKGKPSEWRQYHAIRVNRDGIGMAWFKHPKALLSWILMRPMATLVYLLGDGHPGIWSLFGQMNIAGFKDEILDWFHLKENLYKVDASPDQLETLSSHLWEGQVGQAKAILKNLQTPSAKRFRAYLDQHSQRIPNYRYYQMEGLPIGSGPVESLVKQVDARLQLTGAQWNTESLPQMLKLRCAYLNKHFDCFPTFRE
ncbi:MAG: ISKra4 family transposase [Cyanobacteria bacterium P01_A01_bin.123]